MQPERPLHARRIGGCNSEPVDEASLGHGINHASEESDHRGGRNQAVRYVARRRSWLRSDSFQGPERKHFDVGIRQVEGGTIALGHHRLSFTPRPDAGSAGLVWVHHRFFPVTGLERLFTNRWRLVTDGGHLGRGQDVAALGGQAADQPIGGHRTYRSNRNARGVFEDSRGLRRRNVGMQHGGTHRRPRRRGGSLHPSVAGPPSGGHPASEKIASILPLRLDTRRRPAKVVAARRGLPSVPRTITTDSTGSLAK